MPPSAAKNPAGNGWKPRESASGVAGSTKLGMERRTQAAVLATELRDHDHRHHSRPFPPIGMIDTSVSSMSRRGGRGGR